MKVRAIVIVGVLALGALLVAWVRANLEWTKDKEWVGASGAARTRQFLAAERLALRMGLGARELTTLLELDAQPAGGVLLLPARRQVDSRRQQALLDWAERGGHLVVEAEPLRQVDPLIRELTHYREVIAQRTQEEIPQ